MYVETKRFSIASPLQTHTRKASCQEVDCEFYNLGWRTRTDNLDPAAIKAIFASGRTFTRFKDETGNYFVFPAGQQCFTDHRVSLDRPEFYIVRDSGGGARKHTKPEHWVEEHSEDLEKLKHKIEE